MKLLMENLPASLMADRDVLKQCLEAFAATVPVRKIYLFGSHPRGEAHEDSDIDLCVVADGVKSQFEAARQLRRSTRDIRPKPAFTLIPISPERLAEKEEQRDGFYGTVLKEGVLIATED